MTRILFQRRFNYTDIAVIALAAALFRQERYVIAVIVLLVGSLISAIGETANA